MMIEISYQSRTSPLSFLSIKKKVEEISLPAYDKYKVQQFIYEWERRTGFFCVAFRVADYADSFTFFI